MRRALTLAMLATMLMCGCSSDPATGYSTLSTYPGGISTVAVQIFDNDTFEQEIEFELTEALIKEIEARTGYRVTLQGRADTILTGRVVEVERDQISKSRFTGLGGEVVYRVTIDFQWKDVRTGQSLVERKSFTGDAVFNPSTPLSEPIELGRFAVVQKLARDVVTEMRAAW